MTTLLTRCLQAYHEAAAPARLPSHGIRCTLEHLAAELVTAGHRDAAGWILDELSAKVIPLHRGPEDAA